MVKNTIMSMHDQMEHAEQSILHTYNRFPVMFDRGEGCYLYDTEDKKYLDFAAGIAVFALGFWLIDTGVLAALRAVLGVTLS